MTPMRLAATLAALALLAPVPAAALGAPELAKVVREIDDRQRNQGDWKALCYMEQKEKDKTDVVYELLVFRRDQDDKQMFLFTKPKAEAGKGYLRIEKNLWLSTPRPAGGSGGRSASGSAARTRAAATSTSRGSSRSTTRSGRRTRSSASTPSTGSCSARNPASTSRSRWSGSGSTRPRSTS